MNRLLLYLFIFFFSSELLAQTGATFTQHGPVKFPSNPSVQTTGMGRVSMLVYHPTDSNILFAVTASGGVFKSSNEGQTWKPLSDLLPQTACASLLINPLNPEVMYLGTGDANYNSGGLGVYKTTNGGKSWFVSNTGMGNRMISEMVFTPGDTNTIIAACSDGIYKSTNNGSTWVKKTTVTTSYRDISYRPQSTQILYAASNTHFYRSFNNGETWSQININSTITCAGIKLAVCPSDTSRLYCVAWKTGGTSPFGGLYQSTNNGSTFTLMADTPNILGYSGTGNTMDGQGAYNLALIVDPNNANTLYVGAINVWKSTNQGSNFTLLSHWGYGVHADKHGFLFSPFNPNKLFIYHDGGLDRTTNGGGTWTTFEDGLSASEFYKMGSSQLAKDYILGGLQDNGMDVSINKNYATVRGGDWTGDFAADAFDSSMVYENGGIKRNLFSNATAAINGRGGIYIVHPNDSNVMFELDTNVWRTNNLRANPASGVSWTKISAIPGSLSTGNKCGAFAKSTTGTFYVYFSNQKFYKSENINDASPLFTQITSFPFNSGEAIKQIETCDIDSNVVYVVTTQQRLFKSINKGLTWANITKNLPANTFIKFELDQKVNDSSMYICTAFGVYYRNSSIVNWIPYSTGLPLVAQISDMEILSNGPNSERLYISTYGRGIWQSNLYKNTALAPISELTIQSNSSSACPSDFILVDHSSQAPTSRKWMIQPNTGWVYLNGTDSLSNRAEIRITTAGTYSISLMVSNANGSSITSKTIGYTPLPAASCSTTTTNLSGYGMGIKAFEFNSINNPSSIGVASYTDFTCNNSTRVKAGTTYTAWVTTGTTNAENQKIYIDYNNNGIFTDANELVGTIGSGTGRRSISISILASPPLTNQWLRMRVVTNFGSSATPPCGLLSYGESEDYAIFIDTQVPSLSIQMPKPQVFAPFAANITVSEPTSVLNANAITLTNGIKGTFTQTSPNAYTLIIHPINAGKISLQIAANAVLDLAGNGNPLTLDSTTYSLPAIETNISSASLNFGPNETDTFYSPTGKIMAVLSNNSSYNYGQTTVSIDNAGVGAINFGSNTTANKRIASKTYTVTPSNNNPSGSYQIKLFYTSAELNGWKSITGQQFSNANILKTPNNIASGTLANGVYGTGTSYAVYPGTQDSVITSTFSTGFSGFAIGANTIVLPVHYLSFEAQKFSNHVLLNWSTGSELNNKHFIVERSINNRDWTSIGLVKGKGTTTLKSSYQFEDRQVNLSSSEYRFIYYRLNQIDWDGKSSFSVSRIIELEDPNTSIKVYPQPTQGDVYIDAPNNKGLRFALIDNSGKPILKGSSILPLTPIDLRMVPAGIYYLQISASHEKAQTFKVIKIE